QRRDVAHDLRLLHVLAQVLEQPVQLVLGVLGGVERGLGEVQEGDQIEISACEGLERRLPIRLRGGADGPHLGAVLHRDGAVLGDGAERGGGRELRRVVLGDRRGDGQQRGARFLRCQCGRRRRAGARPGRGRPRLRNGRGIGRRGSGRCLRGVRSRRGRRLGRRGLARRGRRLGRGGLGALRRGRGADVGRRTGLLRGRLLGRRLRRRGVGGGLGDGGLGLA